MALPFTTLRSSVEPSRLFELTTNTILNAKRAEMLGANTDVVGEPGGIGEKVFGIKGLERCLANYPDRLNDVQEFLQALLGARVTPHSSGLMVNCNRTASITAKDIPHTPAIRPSKDGVKQLAALQKNAQIFDQVSGELIDPPLLVESLGFGNNRFLIDNLEGNTDGILKGSVLAVITHRVIGLKSGTDKIGFSTTAFGRYSGEGLPPP
jgi:hypothetical protein